MKLNTAINIIFTDALLSSSLSVMAAEQKIVCLSINLVKQSWLLLDTGPLSWLGE